MEQESVTSENEQKEAESNKSVTSTQEKGSHTLQHDRPNCIGCAACASIAPEFWEMNEDGKSDIIDCAHDENDWQSKDIEQKDFEVNKEAAEACPVNVIHLIDKKTGEKII